MKKNLMLSLAVLGLVGASTLTSCGGGSSGKKLVGITYYNMNDNNMKTYWQPAYRAQAEKYGWEIVETDGTGQTDKVLKGVQDVIAMGADGLAINLNKPVDGPEVMRQAKNAKLPIVFWNKEIAKTDGSLDTETMNSWERAYFVGTDAAEAGRMQGKQYFEWLKTTSEGSWDTNSDGKIQAITVLGEEGHVEAMARSEWSVKELIRCLNEEEHNIVDKSGKKIDGTAVDYSQDKNEITGISDASQPWDLNAAQKHFTDYVGGGSHVEVIFSNNDDMAVGITKSTSFKKGEMKIYGVDCSQAGIAAVKDGSLDGSVLNDSTKQAEVVSALLDKLMKNTDTAAGDTKKLAELDQTSLNEVIDAYKDAGVVWDATNKAFRVPYVAINKDNIGDYFK